jgi:DeoR family transcriptional regulator, aga operon transcriptional repressor
MDLLVDRLFLGCEGVDPERGITQVSLAEAQIQRIMLKSAKSTIVVADGSKIGKVALIRLCDIGAIDTLITGESADPEVVDALRDRGLEVVVAGS